MRMLEKGFFESLFTEARRRLSREKQTAPTRKCCSEPSPFPIPASRNEHGDVLVPIAIGGEVYGGLMREVRDSRQAGSNLP